MKIKYLFFVLLLAACTSAQAEWFLRGTHNGWAATQMLAGGTNTVQLENVVFASAGSIKFDRYGDWKESYGVGGKGGSNIVVAAGTWSIKFYTDTKKWRITAVAASSLASAAASSLASVSSSRSSAASVSATQFHLRGSHNGWAEGDVFSSYVAGSSTNMVMCRNFGSVKPGFKVDPNGGWGDAFPAANAPASGWTRVEINRSSKTLVKTTSNLAENCGLVVSSSSNAVSSSSALVSSAATSASVLASSSSQASSSAESSLLSTRFAVIGDYGWAGQAAADVAALVKQFSPEYVLTVGDNNYSDGFASTLDANVGQYYSEFISPYTGRFGPGGTTNRFYPALGNHDWNTGSIQPYLDYFTLPGNERYYDFVKGPVHFFVIDSDEHEVDGIDVNSSQAQWLRSKLSTATAPWKMVLMHHAPYSSGNHGSVPIMRWPFKDWGADIVIAGHDHHYERLYVAGMTYLVNGLGGRSLYTMKAAIPESHFRYASDYGAMVVEATDSVASFKFVRRTGVTLDSFTLSKGFQHKLPYIFFRGTPNAWGATPMRLVGDNKWQIDVAFTAAATERFKFDVYGDWTQAYGDGNNDSVGDGGDSIPVTLGAGQYRIEFNDITNRYSVQRLNTL